MTQIFHYGKQSHSGDRKTFEVMHSTEQVLTLGSVASFFAATLYQSKSKAGFDR